MSNRWKFVFVAVFAVAALAIVGAVVAISPSAEKLTRRAEESLSAGDNEQAEALSRMALAKQPDSFAATRVNILALIRIGEIESARTRLKSLPKNEQAAELLLEAAQEFFDQGRLTDALHFFPDGDSNITFDSPRNIRLAVASLTRNRAQLHELLNRDDVSPAIKRQVLFAFWNEKISAENLAIIERGAEASPPDALALTALAIHQPDDAQAAQEMVDRALRIDPEILPAIEVRSKLLAETASDRDWEIFVLRLPTAALSSATVWESFGNRCMKEEQWNQAARCYYESIVLHAHSESACQSLVEALQETDEPSLVDVAMEVRATLESCRDNVRELRKISDQPWSEPESVQTTAFACSTRLKLLGRYNEAMHWRNQAEVNALPKDSDGSPPRSELLDKLQGLTEKPLPEWVVRRQQQRRK